jgi:DNA-binding NarL/FixJ family response regulator
MRIVIVEDQTMMRDLLIGACEAVFDSSSVSGAADAATGLALCREVQPDIILLDLELPDRDGLDQLAELRKAAPRAKIIALSSHTDEVTVHRVLQSHIEGFVDKNGQPAKVLREAVATVLEGRRYFSPAVRDVWQRLRDAPGAFNKLLSDREQEVLVLVGRGYTNSEIAQQMALSPNTIQNHRCSIMSKLGLHSSSHLIRYATEKGFTRLRSGGPAER